MNRPLSVLLADDDELVRDCISTWLEDDGFTVHTAASGSEALRLMGTTQVDVALVDLHLGDMDGEELIVRAHAAHPGTRFMIHTGKQFYQLPARLKALGMRQQDIVLKPIFDLDAFAAGIRRLVTGAATHHAN